MTLMRCLVLSTLIGSGNAMALDPACAQGDADRCSSLGRAAFERKQLTDALPLLERALELTNRDVDESQYMARASDLGMVLSRVDRYAEAAPLFADVLAYRRAHVGERDLSTADAHVSMGLVQRMMGHHEAAWRSYQAALDIQQAVLPEDAVELGSTLFNLAALEHQMGEYEAAAHDYERALQVLRAAHGPDDANVATVHNDLSSLYRALGDHAKAIAHGEQAVRTYEGALGPDHPYLAIGLKNLADAHTAKGELSRALRLQERALAITQAQAAPRTRQMAFSHFGIAKAYLELEAFDEALPRFERALDIMDDVAGPDHPDTAEVRSALGALHWRLGDNDMALALLRQALEHQRAKLAPSHPNLAKSVNNLAILELEAGNVDAAIAMFEEVVAVYEDKLDGRSPSLASAYTNLGAAHQRNGDARTAAENLAKAFAIHDAGPADGDFAIATALAVQSALHQDLGDYDEALVALERAIAIDRRFLSPDAKQTSTHLQDLAGLHLARGEPQEALSALAEGIDIQDRFLHRTLAIGTPRQKQAAMGDVRYSLYTSVSLHLQTLPDDPQAAELAVTTLFRRKALSQHAEMLTQRLAADRMEDSEALMELRHAYRLLDEAVREERPVAAGGQPRPQALPQALAAKEALERELARRGPVYALLSERADAPVAGVAGSLEPGMVLLDYVVYRPLDARRVAGERWGNPRYAVYAIGPEGLVAWADLGDQAAIDRRVEELRAQLDLTRPVPAAPASAIQQTAAELYARLLAPLADHLEEARHLLIVPDGQLNLLPFETLWNADANSYLIEERQVSYLTSGLDALEPARRATEAPALIVAGPDYGPSIHEDAQVRGRDDALRSAMCPGTDLLAVVASGLSGDREASRRPNDGGYAPLPGTFVEAETLKGLLGEARVLTCGDATEQAVAAHPNPWALHLATHGRFVPASEPSGSLDAGADALLRSWVALAGANHREAPWPGYLTALEIGALELQGTQVAVLSACATGVGQVGPSAGPLGDELVGMRKALAVAGAQTQLLSLWSVSDRATVELMEGFYRRVLQGQPRAAALHASKLDLLRSSEWSHPVHWAPFVLSGAWGPAHVPTSWTPPSPRTARAPALLFALCTMVFACAAFVYGRLRRR